MAFLPIVLINKNANAFTKDDTSSYVTVGELWNGTNDSNDKTFNGANLKTLFKYISSDGIINGVSSSATATDIRGYTYNGKSSSKAVVVTLGGLKWQVVYLTTDTSGNKVATLWLTNSTQEAFSGRSSTEGAYYGYLNGGLYSDWSANWYDAGTNTGKYPSNMYSTSYIRVVTLNNGGQYATGTSKSNSSTLSSTISKSPISAFAPFTVTSNGLTAYIVQPKYISYQTETESTSNPLQCKENNGQNNFLNNESINRGGSGGYNYYNTSITYAKYGEWGSDYLWLPSMSEMGNGNTRGIWAVNEAERKNYDGSTAGSLGTVGLTSGSAYAYTWTRSAHYNVSSLTYYVNPSGASSNYSFMNESYAIRPALHLNLSSAFSSIITVSTSVNNESYGTVSGAGEYGRNSTATITANSNPGYLFDYWMVGSNRIEKNPYSFVITDHTSVTAYFKAGCLVTLNTNNANYGSVLGAGTYESGTPITLTASPKPGYAFSYWLDGGGGRYTSNVIQTTITSNLTFSAYFEPIYGLNITSDSAFTYKAKEINSSQIDYYITAPSGYYIYSIQVGTNPAQIMKYRKGLLDYAGNSVGINYVINETGNYFMLSLLGAISITDVNLVFVNQPPILNNPVGAGGISGINVCATYGGIASVVGDNFDTLGDNDTITFISRVTTSGYAFDKWVDQDGNTISTNASAKLTKKQVYDKQITAIFVKTENLNTNDKTNDDSSGVI